MLLTATGPHGFSEGGMILHQHGTKILLSQGGLGRGLDIGFENVTPENRRIRRTVEL